MPHPGHSPTREQALASPPHPVPPVLQRLAVDVELTVPARMTVGEAAALARELKGKVWHPAFGTQGIPRGRLQAG